MARTNRKAALAAAAAAAATAAAPPTNAKALDELNLDDMFNEGDGTLFDGIDIDLDGMGELSNQKSTEQQQQQQQSKGTSSAAAPKKDLDAMQRDTSHGRIKNSAKDSTHTVSARPTTATETTTRRKTKRKIKPPPRPMDDGSDDDEDYIQSTASARKRKRRPTKGGGTSTKRGKTKSSAKTTAAAAAGAKVATTMPPPLKKTPNAVTGIMSAAASHSAPSSNNKKALSLAQTAARSSDLRRASSGGSAVSSEASSSVVPSESTYCGLRPSKTEFYPFMDAVPPEPSIKKNHRAFPIAASIHHIISPPTSNNSGNNKNASTSSSSSNNNAVVKDTEGIYKILTADFDQMMSDRNTSQAANDQRRANLGRAIATARHTVSQAETRELLQNLYSMCFLLKRQYDFLNQNMSNMERWCSDNLTPQDYQAVYGTGGSLATATGGGGSSSSFKRGASSGGRGGGGAGNLVASLKSPIVKVRVKCSGFKAPRSGPLIANVRLPGRAVSSSVKNETSKSATSKKRKASSNSSSNETDRTALVSGILVPEDVAVREVSYADMKPYQRRKFVADAIAQRAQHLEQQVYDMRERRKRALEKQRADMQKVVNEDEILATNTMTMWKWLEKAPYFADFSELDVREVLESLWEPEVTQVEMRTVSADVASAELADSKSQASKQKSSDMRPSDSLFLRLQSLLVDERSDDDDGEDEQSDEDDNDLWMGDQCTSELMNSSDGSAAMLDLSGLSLEERTFLHLRAAGLVDAIPSSVVSTQPSLVEEDDASSLQSSRAKSMSNGPDRRPVGTDRVDSSKNDIDSLLLAMQADLADQRRLNNSRLDFLEMAAKSHLKAARQRKKREEENSSLLARYNQLVKKQKEAKKHGRNKIAKKDGDWMPW